jgi:hypothetical protein
MRSFPSEVGSVIGCVIAQNAPLNQTQRINPQS